MRVSAKTDYAVRAMLELTTAPDATPVKAEAIAEAQGIPAPFLQNILQTLRNGGLVESRRGQVGGHRLAKPPTEITVADVIRAVDGPLGQVAGRAPEDVAYDGSAEHLRDAWVAVRAAVRGVLEHLTLADLAAGRLPDDVRALLGEPDAWHRR
ncbi:Rrf2 family transcriptional regulator [Conexibacter sp. SYSU D00693]|uniref:RrF2 family transcriptional regulator n=1 Tax=Conexibacter sp. SYSU D00693 TaxID=2812560 RepID=UPI00196BAD0B|nr:Rrf2 family transcriptional regulator [Conexibacter sp. SYSU D00693]